MSLSLSCVILGEQLRLIGSCVHRVISGLDPFHLVALPPLGRCSHPQGQNEHAEMGKREKS